MKAIANTTIRLGLINLPCQIVQAVEKANDVTFTQGGPNGEKLRQAYLLPDGTEVAKDDIQKGIFQGEDFFPISKDDLEAIAEATKLPDLEVLEVIDMADFNMQQHRVTDYYYVQNQKKAGNVNAFKLFVDALQSEEKALVTKWTARSRQKLLVIWAEGGLLKASGMCFDGDVREPDEGIRSHLAGQYSDQEMEMAKQLLGALAGGAKNALSMEVDEAIPMKHQLVDDALSGNAIEVEKAAPAKAEANAALADALAASLAAVSAAKEKQPA